MENKITPFLSVCFTNANGNQFCVQYGHTENSRIPMCKVNGKHIPFPVFAGTWFRGIPESQMEKNLSEIGYVKYARVNLLTGAVQVFDVPEAETNPVIESVIHSVQNAWADAYEADAHRLYRAYKMLGGTETMENIIAGVEFGSINRIPFDAEILTPHQFETLIRAMRVAKANGYEDLVTDLYDIYYTEKREDVESLEDIVSKVPEMVVRDMTIEELDKIKGLRHAAEVMTREMGRRVAAICMIRNWANCTIKSARDFVDFIEKTTEC